MQKLKIAEIPMGSRGPHCPRTHDQDEHGDNHQHDNPPSKTSSSPSMADWRRTRALQLPTPRGAGARIHPGGGRERPSIAAEISGNANVAILRGEEGPLGGPGVEGVNDELYYTGFRLILTHIIDTH